MCLEDAVAAGSPYMKHPNNRVEFARVARPTRKSDALLLAAHAKR